MLFNEIRPFVRYSQELVLGVGWQQRWVKAYDHRLIYITSGSGKAEIGDITKELTPGDLLYWPAGTVYRLSRGNESVLGLICINFDYTQRHADIVRNMPPVSENEYISDKQTETPCFSDTLTLNGIIVLENQAAIGAVLKEMDSESRRPDAYTGFQLNALMSKALCMLVRRAEGPRARRSPASDIIEYIHAHYTEPITNATLAKHFNYHANYISQLIRRHTGLALHHYLLKVRIDNALRMINSTNMPLSEIAADVGFHSFSYFSQYFKKQTGYSPSAFRSSGM